jgi:predicted permease
LLALSGLQLPPSAITIVAPIAQMTGPLILIALGIFFSLKIAKLPIALGIASIRLGLGLLVGILLASALGLEGITYAVIVLCCAGPIGFNALTYSSLAKLDAELSASAVSISILAGLIYIPALIYLLGSSL